MSNKMIPLSLMLSLFLAGCGTTQDVLLNPSPADDHALSEAPLKLKIGKSTESYFLDTDETIEVTARQYISTSNRNIFIISAGSGEVTLSGENAPDFRLEKHGDLYTLSAASSPLRQGTYSFTVTAKSGNRKIEQAFVLKAIETKHADGIINDTDAPAIVRLGIRGNIPSENREAIIDMDAGHDGLYVRSYDYIIDSRLDASPATEERNATKLFFSSENITAKAARYEAEGESDESLYFLPDIYLQEIPLSDANLTIGCNISRFNERYTLECTEGSGDRHSYTFGSDEMDQIRSNVHYLNLQSCSQTPHNMQELLDYCNYAAIPVEIR